MRNPLNVSILTIVVVLAILLVVLAQIPAGPGSGESSPDLSGVWRAEGGNVRGFNLKEPPSLAPWAAEMYQANREGVEDPLESGADEMDPSIYCLPDGMPRVYLVNYPLEIVQVPGRMYMLFENTHLVRRIYMDGRKMPEDYPPSFMGYSTGRWEEDTLVVETVGLDDLSWLDRVGTPHSDALRIVERIRRVDHDTLEIDFLFEDPNAFTKSLEGKRVFQLQPDWEIMEHNGFCEDRQRYDYSQKSLLGTDKWIIPGEY
jgi:hypothetical protein